ncbi:glycoside hydrolase family 31 protein [Paenibacillus thailandensis]|uniref:Glycoside hydrolase family 31 protein n=1 Tax=Paenibacillus thailandensis TaxID=393250 RepID=A0ABW5QY65_9BACL
MEGSEAIHPDKSAESGALEARVTTGPFRKLEKDGEAYIVRGETGCLAFRFLTDDLFRIVAFRGEAPDWRTTPAVEEPQGGPGALTVEETEDAVRFATGSVAVIVDKSDLAVTVTNPEGGRIMRQEPVQWNGKAGVGAAYAMAEETHFYGLGEKTGFLDKRGEKYTNWNTDVYAPHVPEIEALYQSIPFVIPAAGGNGYGLFLDNPGRTDFDMRSEADRFTIGCSTGSFSLYFINGPSLKQIVSRYTALTGRMELPPKWALGYHQSRYSYMTQQEVLELARTFREKHIPCDVIYLDIHYMDEYRVFTFDPARFPDPEGMMRELRELGVRIVPIVDPGVKKDAKYPIYQEGVRGDHFCRKLEGDIYFGDVWPGTSAFPDFTEERTAKWWGEKHEFYTKLGISGIWNDMNEPALFNESKTMDLDVIHRNNGNPLTHEELHNLYGMLMSKATYEGLAERLGGQRPFVLTRAGYAGIQRYAAVWTGDNRSFWEHMALAVPMVLNMGLSGIPFAGPDVGGFAHHTSGQLLARWTQMGVFFPYLRNHSAIQTVRQEPWSFGPEVEAIVREYVGMRYRWMPHLYNLFRDAAETGLPVMRPLLLEYPADPNVANLSDQFLLGEDVLVAPVFRPDTDYRAVYLPEGVWIDYWTGEALEGGRHILAHAPLEKLPLYIRKGAVIAEGPLKQHADDPVREYAEFNVYGASAAADFRADYALYEDDGTSFAYREGEFDVLRANAAGTGAGLTLSWSYENGCRIAANRKTVRFRLRYPDFALGGAAVEGLAAITPEQLASGAIGYIVDTACGELIVQAADAPQGGRLAVRIG